MVEFHKLYENESLVVYEYYPEGKISNMPGVIQVNKKESLISVVQCAEGDFHHADSDAKIELLKEKTSHAHVNEKQWEYLKASNTYHYGSKVIRSIVNHYSRNHEFISKGKLTWY